MVVIAQAITNTADGVVVAATAQGVGPSANRVTDTSQVIVTAANRVGVARITQCVVITANGVAVAVTSKCVTFAVDSIIGTPRAERIIAPRDEVIVPCKSRGRNLIILCAKDLIRPRRTCRANRIASPAKDISLCWDSIETITKEIVPAADRVGFAVVAQPVAFAADGVVLVIIPQFVVVAADEVVVATCAYGVRQAANDISLAIIANTMFGATYNIPNSTVGFCLSYWRLSRTIGIHGAIKCIHIIRR